MGIALWLCCVDGGGWSVDGPGTDYTWFRIVWPRLRDSRRLHSIWGKGLRVRGSLTNSRGVEAYVLRIIPFHSGNLFNPVSRTGWEPIDLPVEDRRHLRLCDCQKDHLIRRR